MKGDEEAKQNKAINELKVLLVGNSDSGKTSLLRRLLGEEFNPKEPRTTGIKIRQGKIIEDKINNNILIKGSAENDDKNGNTIKVNFWDFGCYEIMHATDQFFLTERSLYILVLDARREDDGEYWLKHIKNFCGDSPILVVMNKMEQNKAFDLNRRRLQKKYNGITGFYPVSCANNERIDVFTKDLINALSSIDHIKKPWPISWFNVKELLTRMDRHFISYDEFIAICKKENITEEE